MRLALVFVVCVIGNVSSGRCAPKTTAPPAAANCARCARPLITITTANPAAKPFRSDTISTVNGCAVRTFTCAGTNSNIEINRGQGVIADGDDGSTDGVATLTVTCNAAGTGWTISGVTVTHVECASA